MLGFIKQRKSYWVLGINNSIHLFYCPQSPSQVWVMMIRNWLLWSKILNPFTEARHFPPTLKWLHDPVTETGTSSFQSSVVVLFCLVLFFCSFFLFFFYISLIPRKRTRFSQFFLRGYSLSLFYYTEFLVGGRWSTCL